MHFWKKSFALIVLSVSLSAGIYSPVLAQTVRSWGDNTYGQLGDGTTTLRSTPVAASALINPIAIAAGNSHSLALRIDGTVWAWGRNDSGQVGDGTEAHRTSPVAVTGLSGGVGIAAGGFHSLAVKNDGTIWAWGYNASGQLGNGSFLPLSSLPVQVSGVSDAVSVGAGYYHSLVVRRNGTVLAWGQNFNGQLGDGTYADRRTPVAVANLSNVAAVAAGRGHSLALKRDGTVWAWGSNGSGELGDGTTTQRTTPVQVVGLTDAIAIAAGLNHSLALTRDGTVWAWGANVYGQLGDGTTANSSEPFPVANLSDVAAIGAGAAHSLAVKRDGTIWAWGLGSFGQMGNGTFTVTNALPVQVSAVTEMAGVAGGEAHSLAVRSSALSGQIQFEGIVTGAPPQNVTFTFTPSNGIAINRTLNVPAAGTYSLAALAPGTYTVRVKSGKYLARTFSISLASGQAATLNFSLKTGDANGDNAVDITDLLILIAHYNKVAPNAGYLEEADFNGDGVNDVNDLLLLIGNYNQGGA